MPNINITPSMTWTSGLAAYTLTLSGICPVCRSTPWHGGCDGVMAAVAIGAAILGRLP